MRARLVALLGAIILFTSGCVGSGAGGASATGSSANPAPTGFDDSTGAILGLVVDDSFAPVPKAQAAIRDRPGVAVTDESGRFEIGKLEPGSYVVDVAALGYDAIAKTVEVAAGEALEVQFTLVSAAIVEAYPELRTFEGLIECGFGTSAVVGNCIPLQFLFQMIGTNPTNTRTVGLYVVTDPSKVEQGIFEMEWTPSAGGTSQALGLYVDEEGAGPTSGTNYENAEGPSPVRIEITDEPYKALQPDQQKNKIQTRTFLPGTTPPTFTVNQRFTIYGTHCYNAPCGDEYSAIKDG